MNASLIVAIILGCLAFFMILKIGRFMLKVIFGLVVLSVLGGAVWWLLLRH